MKKKILTFLLMFLLIIPCVFLVTACGGDSDSTGSGGGSGDGGEQTTPVVPTTHTISFYIGDLFVGTGTYSSYDQFEYLSYPQIAEGKYDNYGWFLDKGVWQQPLNSWSVDVMSLPTTFDAHLYFKSWFNVVNGELVDISANLMWEMESDELVIPEKVRDCDGEQTITSVSFTGWYYDQTVKTITLPNTVQEIKEGAFHSFEALETINFESDRYENANYLYDKETKLFIWTNGNITEIPSEVEKIGKYALDGLNVETFTVPNTVTAIGERAFRRARITNLNLSNSLETIGESAFEFSTIGSIEIPKNIRSIGANAFYSATVENLDFEESADGYKNLTLGENCFEAYLTNVTVPFIGSDINNSTTAEYLFQDYTSINSLVVTNAKTIVEGCFKSLDVRNLTISNTLESCGSKIFSNYFPRNLTVPFIGRNRTDIENANMAWYLSDMHDSFELVTLTITDSCVLGSNFTGGRIIKNYIFEKLIKKIDDEAFKDSYYVDTMSFENGIEEIGESAFESCGFLRNINLGVGTKIIGKNAFKNCYYVTQITIPEGVTFIGDGAFEGNVNGVAITIPSTVESIGANAFANSNVTSIAFAENSRLQSIGDYAFKNILGIQSLTIPKSVTSIGTSILYAWDQLETLSTPKLNNVIRTWFGSSVPDTLTTVSLTNETQVIDNAFANADSITTIYLNNEITSIGSNSFPTTITSINIPTSLKTIKANAFNNCSLLEGLTLPETLESIGDYAFKNVTNAFTTLKIGKNVTSIGIGAFNGVAISGIELDSNNTTFTSNGSYLVEESAKRVLIGSAEVNISSYNRFDPYSFKDVALTQANFSNELSYIGEYAFANTGLTTLNLPQSLEYMGESAFFDCPLTTLRTPFMGYSRTEPKGKYNIFGEVLNETLTTINIYDCEVMGNVSNAKKLTDVTLCDSITALPDYAFSGCETLEQITLPKNSTQIGEYAFSNCVKLSKINFSENLTHIGQYAFSSCQAFAWFQIPNTVTHLGEAVFSNCDSLIDVYIPNSVEYIGGHQFYPLFRGCSNIKWVYCEFESDDAKDGFNSGWLGNTNGTTGYEDPILGEYFNCKLSADKLWVYDADDETIIKHYRGADTNLVLDSNITKIEEYAFGYNESLVSVDISKTTLTQLEEAAFGYCINLKTVIFPETLETINSTAFMHCSSLDNVDILNVKTIEGNAFYNCNGLTTINFRKVETISYTAFYNTGIDTGLLIMPDTLKYMEGDAFNARYETNIKVKKIYIPASATITYGASECINIYLGATTYNWPTVPANYHFDCKIKDGLLISNDETIAHYVFADGEVTLPATITKIKFNFMDGKSKVTKLIIPDSVTEIEYSSDCPELTYLRFGAGIKTYGRIPFSGCPKLETMVFSYGINTINDDTRLYPEDYPSLKNLYFPQECYVKSNFIGAKGVFNVFYAGSSSDLSQKIPGASLNALNNYLYMSEDGLNNMSALQAELESLEATYEGVYEFEIIGDTVGIKNYLGEKTTHIVIPKGIKAISGGFTYLGLESFELNDVEYIYAGFKGNNFTELNLTNVKVIGEMAFAQCALLTKINLPSAVELYHYAFYECTSLTDIALSNNVKILHLMVFYNCTSLTHIYIPDSVEQIIRNTNGAGDGLCTGCAENLIIYTGAKEGKAGFGTSWNRKTNSTFYETHYEVSYEEYLQIVNGTN